MRTKQEQNKVRRRLLYLWFPHFSIERHKRIEIDKRAKQDDFSGIIIIQDRAGRRVVIASCPLAFQMGVTVGHRLRMPWQRAQVYWYLMQT